MRKLVPADPKFSPMRVMDTAPLRPASREARGTGQIWARCFLHPRSGVRAEPGTWTPVNRSPSRDRAREGTTIQVASGACEPPASSSLIRATTSSPATGHGFTRSQVSSGAARGGSAPLSPPASAAPAPAVASRSPPLRTGALRRLATSSQFPSRERPCSRRRCPRAHPPLPPFPAPSSHRELVPPHPGDGPGAAPPQRPDHEVQRALRGPERPGNTEDEVVVRWRSTSPPSPDTRPARSSRCRSIRSPGGCPGPDATGDLLHQRPRIAEHVVAEVHRPVVRSPCPPVGAVRVAARSARPRHAHRAPVDVWMSTSHGARWPDGRRKTRRPAYGVPSGRRTGGAPSPRLPHGTLPRPSAICSAVMGRWGVLLAGRLRTHHRGGDDVRRAAHRFPSLVQGTTHVPVARHTTIGFGSTSAAEADTSGRGLDHLARSKRILRLVRPTSVISRTASMKSPANTGRETRPSVGPEQSLVTVLEMQSSWPRPRKGRASARHRPGFRVVRVMAGHPQRSTERTLMSLSLEVQILGLLAISSTAGATM
jgi:hypothetical protein